MIDRKSCNEKSALLGKPETKGHGSVRTSVVSAGQQSGSMSKISCMFNLITAGIGAGILALPKPAWEVGWGGTLVLLSLVGTVCSCTAVTLVDTILLIERKYNVDRIGSMDEIAYWTLGRVGQKIVMVLMNLTLFAIGILFFILLGKMMNQSFPVVFGLAMSSAYWQATCALLIMPMALLKDLSQVAKAASVGVMASFLTLIAIMCGAFDAVMHNGSQTVIDPDALDNVITVDALPMAFIAFMFSFGASLVVPTCRRDIARLDDLKPAIHASHIITTGIYVSLCILAIFGWGPTLATICPKNGAITDVMKDESGVFTWFGFIAQVSVALNLMVSYPIFANVLFSFADQTYISTFKFNEEATSFYVLSKVTRVSIVTLNSVIAIWWWNYFAVVVKLIATANLIPITVMLPIAYYWAIKTKFDGFMPSARAEPLKFLFHATIFTVSLVVTCYSCLELIKENFA